MSADPNIPRTSPAMLTVHSDARAQSGSSRPHLPTRASTVGGETENNTEPSMLPYDSRPHSKSEDLNHGSRSTQLSQRPPPNFASSAGSRPSSPVVNDVVLTDVREGGSRRLSVVSHSSDHSSSSSHAQQHLQTTATSSTCASVSSTVCSSCQLPLQGSLVRALSTVFHLNCFKCMDCGDIVASKFFPIDGPDGKQQPLCERDYFRRLNLICNNCDMALRGSYITACNKKYHVEHFTCSLCDTVFGQSDSYYEHESDVFCHFHYSTRFATKCAGCSSAILKQFVEINRNMRDECWHPECYMINKFWNVKVGMRRPTSILSQDGDNLNEPYYLEEERIETPASLRDKQAQMETEVFRIWNVLSNFEESSAACISAMLSQVSCQQYLDAIRMAERFILHVEVLFATIDDLEHHFASLGLKGLSHVREARMLCRKTVELFGLLSQTQEAGPRRGAITQELLALVTGIAHYLKILIRIALTGALKLEQEHSVREAMSGFLDKLNLLAVQGGNPTARRLVRAPNGTAVIPVPGTNYGTQGVNYGFRSLAPENAGESPFAASSSGQPARISSQNPPSDLCVTCHLTVEEDCVRLGTYQRWHSHCVQCAKCGKVAAVPSAKEQAKVTAGEEGASPNPPQKLSTARRPPANVSSFVYDAESCVPSTSFGDVPTKIFCTEHQQGKCRSGFQAVSRLEQYAFLLNVALRRLYILLRQQGVVPASPTTVQSSPSPIGNGSDQYRNSTDIMKMKSVHLDRKISATARLPKRSTIVESPAGKIAHPSDSIPVKKSHDSMTSPRPAPQPPNPSQQQVRSPPIPQQSSPTPQRPHLGSLPIPNGQGQGQILRPNFARNNTEVMIVDDSAPNSPSGGMDETIATTLEDGITLADIPQVAQAELSGVHHVLGRHNTTPYISELNPLALAIVKHAAVAALSRSALASQFDLDEILELVEAKKAGFWTKLLRQNNDKKIKKKGVFGIPLEVLVEREGSDSTLGITQATLRVPSFVDDVISAMRQMDMSVEGIFRKNGNIRRLKELTDAIDFDPASVDLTQDNPVQLAALLKKFLREMPDPLMTFKLHRLLIASQSSAVPLEAERIRLLHIISLLLPKSHRDTMEVLFVFLKWVASFAHMDEETGSKMDLVNLATVICPSILYSRGRDAVRDETFGAVRVVTALLENQDIFFTVPQEFMPLLRDQDQFAAFMDLPSKDFMKKCDAHMRSNKSNGGRPHMAPVNGYHSQLNTRVSERPPIGSNASHPNLRPTQGGIAPSASYHNTPMSPVQSVHPPTPFSDYTPSNSSRTLQSSNISSRPPSVIQPRPSGEHAFDPMHTNGHPAAVVRHRS